MIRAYDGKKPKIDPSAFIFENTSIIGDVEIGKDCIIYPGAVLRSDVKGCKIIIEEGTVIQDNCVVHVSDEGGVFIGKNANIGHASVIHSCYIGEYTTIGMNSVIQNKAHIGELSTIGAGAVVSQRAVIPPKSLAYGIPAKVVRELSEAEVQTILVETPEHYTNCLKIYRKDAEDNK